MLTRSVIVMTTTGQLAGETDSGEWKRQGNRFTDRITTDSESGPGEGPDAAGPDPSAWTR